MSGIKVVVLGVINQRLVVLFDFVSRLLVSVSQRLLFRSPALSALTADRVIHHFLLGIEESLVAALKVVPKHTGALLRVSTASVLMG